MLKSHGVERSHRGVQVMLASRIYLGEVHFGKLVNLTAHEPTIDRELWTRVQRMVIPRGPRPSSDRLLARLGILRCGSCGARLGAMKLPKQGDYPIYRCPSTSDCARHVTISARIAEDVVSAAVRDAVSDVDGRASAAENASRPSGSATARKPSWTPPCGLSRRPGLGMSPLPWNASPSFARRVTMRKPGSIRWRPRRR